MLIAIMSDSHEHRDNLNKAVAIVNERKADALIFGGDLMAPGLGTKALLQFEGPIHYIM
jgi:predicted phosphodiesterase